jgi:hypothetical protein
VIKITWGLSRSFFAISIKVERSFTWDNATPDEILGTVRILNKGDRQVYCESIYLLGPNKKEVLLFHFKEPICLTHGQKKEYIFDKKKTGLTKFLTKERKNIDNIRVVVVDTLGKKWYSKRPLKLSRFIPFCLQ